MNLDVIEGGEGLVAVRLWLRALAVLKVSATTVAVVPRRENKRHTAFDGFRKFAKIFPAVLHHDDFVITLGDSGPHSPES